MIPAFRFVRPNSLREAVHELSAPGAYAYAGGIDLLGCMRDGVLTPNTVVALSRLRELHGVEQTAEGGLRIGTLTTLSEIAAHPVIKARYTALSRAAASAATPQLRNQGTIGGNLCQKPRCWYFRGDFPCVRKGGDTCFGWEGENQFHCIFGGNGCYYSHPSDLAPAIVALDAQMRIAGPNGNRSVPAGSFFVLPSTDVTKETLLQSGEILTEVVLPPWPAATRSTYLKRRMRGSWDFALAGVALTAELAAGYFRNPRIVLSGVAPIPWRTKEAEAVLDGQQINTSVAARVADAALIGADPLSKNAYKIRMVHTAVQDALMSL